MRLVKQPQRSKCCGQCCLAMVLDLPYEQIVEEIGGVEETTAKQLTAVLETHGFVTFSDGSVPDVDVELLRIAIPEGAHWVVRNDGYVFDPDAGVLSSAVIRQLKILERIQVWPCLGTWLL